MVESLVVYLFEVESVEVESVGSGKCWKWKVEKLKTENR